MTNHGGGESIASRYQAGATALLDGSFPVSFTDLPPVAIEPTGVYPEMADYRHQDRPVHEWLEANRRWLEGPYKHLAWWAFHGFREAADAESLTDEQGEKFFSPLGRAGILGFLQMSRHLTNITYVYSEQIEAFHTKPRSYEEQAREIIGIALASIGDLEVIARQTSAVAGRLEGNADHRPTMRSWTGPNLKTANHLLELTDQGRGPSVHIRRLDEQVALVTDHFERAVAAEEVEPQRQIGCFALKVGEQDASVFFQVWHGLTLAAAHRPQVMQAQLRAIDTHKDEYGFIKK